MLTDAYWVAFNVCAARCIYNMYDGIGLSQVIQECIAQTPAFMCIRDQPGNVYDLNRHEPGTVLALTAWFAQAFTWAINSYMGNSVMGINGCEWMVCHLHIGKRSSIEERALA